jgi:hypothetical protein
VAVENIPVFSGLISLCHTSSVETNFANESDKDLIWRAMFQGAFTKIKINGEEIPAKQYLDPIGNEHSYADVNVKAKSQARARAVPGK